MNEITFIDNNTNCVCVLKSKGKIVITDVLECESKKELRYAGIYKIPKIQDFIFHFMDGLIIK